MEIIAAFAVTICAIVFIAACGALMLAGDADRAIQRIFERRER